MTQNSRGLQLEIYLPSNIFPPIDAGQRGCQLIGATNRSAQVVATMLVFAALAFPRDSFAQDTGGGDPLIGDRPDFTESAITIAPGRVQVEAGMTHTEDDQEEVIEVGEVLVRIGLAERLELRVGVGSWARVAPEAGESFDGYADPSIGFKLGLGQHGAWTAALLASATVPAGSSEFRERHVQPDVVVAAERDLTEVVSIAINAGYAYVSSAGDQYGEAFASVAMGVAVGEQTGVFFEVYGLVPEGGVNERSTAYLDMGVTRAIGADLQFDARVGVGLNGAAAESFFGVGVIWRH